jgi:5,10-methylenetetrahydromethanopterin reductase
VERFVPPTFTIALQTDKPLNRYGPLARQIEAYGFDGLSVYNDLLYQPAWLPLLEIARVTERLRLGPAAVNPFTCHPLNIAGNIALLDEASNGRAYLALARGAWLDFIGLEPDAPVAALREAFRCVRHLLCRDRALLPGKHFPLAGGDTLRWSGGRPDIPFMLGSWGTKTLLACLDQISEVKLGGTANPDVAAWFKDFLVANGRSDVDVVVGAVTVVDEDGAAARALARREVALYLPVIAELDPTLTIDPELMIGLRAATAVFDFERAAAFVSDELLARFAFAGTPQEVAAQTTAVAAAGAGRVEFGTPHGLSAATGLALLGERVLPAVRWETYHG